MRTRAAGSDLKMLGAGHVSGANTPGHEMRGVAELVELLRVGSAFAICASWAVLVKVKIGGAAPQEDARSGGLPYSAGTPRTKDGSPAGGIDPEGGGGTIGVRPTGNKPATSRRAYSAGTPRTKEPSGAGVIGMSVPADATRPSAAPTNVAPGDNA
jgi:hypothetical protein